MSFYLRIYALITFCLFSIILRSQNTDRLRQERIQSYKELNSEDMFELNWMNLKSDMSYLIRSGDSLTIDQVLQGLMQPENLEYESFSFFLINICEHFRTCPLALTQFLCDNLEPSHFHYYRLVAIYGLDCRHSSLTETIDTVGLNKIDKMNLHYTRETFAIDQLRMIATASNFNHELEDYVVKWILDYYKRVEIFEEEEYLYIHIIPNSLSLMYSKSSLWYTLEMLSEDPAWEVYEDVIEDNFSTWYYGYVIFTKIDVTNTPLNKSNLTRKMILHELENDLVNWKTYVR